MTTHPEQRDADTRDRAERLAALLVCAHGACTARATTAVRMTMRDTLARITTLMCAEHAHTWVDAHRDETCADGAPVAELVGETRR
jgi:hypothetical protein